MAPLASGERLERSPLQSKKFIAYMVTEFLWKSLAFLMIWKHGENLTMQGTLLALILVAGFISVTYIGGQAALDHYTRVARIIGGKSNGNGSADAR